jgi:2-polyprenyl-3-methyl-5-hydroxy-6-metoxy-1,4-benzoquinol methylase
VMTNKVKCWCGSQNLERFSDFYVKCPLCKSLVSTYIMPKDFYKETKPDESFYGQEYWMEYVKTLGYPDITERARNDLSERDVYWLRALLQYKLPPARTLELGCAHGGLVFLMKMAGYDAQGAEMSKWICEYASKTFDIPMLCGAIEDFHIPKGSMDVILMMDVLEHMPDPVDGLGKIAAVLKEDGLAVIQTPCWRETDKTYDEMKTANSVFLCHLKEREHLYLFSEISARKILNQLGFQYIILEPPIYSYDMFIFVSKSPLSKNDKKIIDAALLKNPQSRLILALIDFYYKLDKKDELLSACEADRAARLEVIYRQEREFSGRLKAYEADRAALVDTIKTLKKQLDGQRNKEQNSDRGHDA